MVLEQLRELMKRDADRPPIIVDGVTETFRLYHERPGGLKERLYRFRRASYTDFNALEDVTFTIDRGETVGIIGPNGSGKSTLLKVLARILEPDEGRVEINGRVASLLELGAGFHGDLTGRENIYLNGAILGLSRAEITERFDDIVEFAGVRPFLDTPVRNYSSGMYVRLGFAIAVHVDPDILLVDEVLSVGDVHFQAKSLARVRDFQARGKTIVLVSHDLNAIAEFCDRTIVLRDGTVRFDGPAQEGIALYSQLMESAAPGEVRPAAAKTPGLVRVVDVQLLDTTGKPAQVIAPSTPLVLRIKVRAREPIAVCSVGARISTTDRQIYEVHTSWQGLGIGPLDAGQSATVDFRFTTHVLAGTYNVEAVVTNATGREQFDHLPGALSFEIEPAPGATGLVDLRAAAAVASGPAVNLDADPRWREEDITPEQARELHPASAPAPEQLESPVPAHSTGELDLRRGRESGR